MPQSRDTYDSGAVLWDQEPAVLREYALIADGERGALLGPDGGMAWLCFPRWDSPAVFSSLIGGGGRYNTRPTGRWVWGGRYEDGLIWRSRWTTSNGHVECRQALALPGRPDQVTVLRQVSALEDDAELEITLDLRAEFGRLGVRDLHLDEQGAWRGRLGTGSFCWTGAAAAVTSRTERHTTLEHRLRLKPGESLDLVLTLSCASSVDAPSPATAWAETEQGWRERLPTPGTLGNAERDVRHGYAILHGLTSSSGAMAAAATLGLPERAEAGRNYDYRYAWIRDQCIVGQAAAEGDHGSSLLAGSVRFVTERLLEHGPDLAPAYRVDGGAVPSESRLDLPGYPGGAAVVGNRAREQFQLDTFGEALSLFAKADRHDLLDPDSWSAVEVAVDAIAARHQEPDAGIWELSPQLWTQSRLQCAAGLRAISRRPRAGSSASAWTAFADQLVGDVGASSLHPTGRWQRSPSDPKVDAALLLPAIRGAVPPSDPRTTATLAAVLGELVEDGYCYRFRQSARPLAQDEGAFLFCGFLVALSLLDQGEVTAATSWFERTRAGCGPPGLMTEEFDVRQRQLRGNLPQAFVHALLIQTAHRLDTDRGCT